MTSRKLLISNVDVSSDDNDDDIGGYWLVQIAEVYAFKEIID